MPDHTDHDSWDVIVIGGGPVGENAAEYAAEGAGLRVLIVERELLGGECSYFACIPSKAMLRPVEVLGAARHLGGTAQLVGDRQLDVAAVLERRDRFVNHLSDASQVAWAEGKHLELARGTGRLSGERTVELEEPDGTRRTLTARYAVVLATGTRALIPPVPGLADALPWTSRYVTNLHEVPRRVVMVGGGVVASESATWLRHLGCEKVTVVEQGPQLLGRTEPEAARLVAQRFTDAGVGVQLGRKVTGVSRTDPADTGLGFIHGGEVRVELDDGTVIVCDEVVAAAGRVPNSADIGLDSVGLSANPQGYLDTDDHMTVGGTDWLYCVGDLCGRALLTHMGKYQARIAGDVIAARAQGRPLDADNYRDLSDHGAIPQVTFTDPEVGSVGLTAAAARDAGLQVETVDYEMGNVAGAALVRDGYQGWARLVVDTQTDTLVGVTFVGDNVAELIHSATVAVVGKVPVALLWHAVPSYPTVSEVWLRLLEGLRSQRAGA